MAVDTNLNFQSLFDSLKLEDPWLPPSTWDSISSQSPLLPSQSSTPSSVTVSESSLVRLSMNALQGLESSLISVDKFSAAFRSDPSDNTFHRIPSLWNRFSSTHALGNILSSIGSLGFLVFLLHKFVHHFTQLNTNQSNLQGCEINCEIESKGNDSSRNSLVNQAFAVSVRKILEGYTCALDSLHASVGLRKSSKVIDDPFHDSSVEGCLMNVVHSETTLLEMYLHTKELRTQIEVLGNICNLHDVAKCFSSSPFQDLVDKATSQFCNFHRGGDLLTYLYTQLQVADPAHCAILKFLFLRSYDPYCAFIRSWIYKAEIVDPYAEFVVEYVDDKTSNLSTAGISTFPLARTRERKGVSVPCFIKELVVPLLRAGQQLQVLVKLLDFGTSVATAECTYDDFLPSWTGFCSNNMCHESAISFSKESVGARVLARDIYYESMQKKLEILLKRIEFNYQQVVIFANVGGDINAPLSVKSDNSITAPGTDGKISNMAIDNADFDDSPSLDKFDSAVDVHDSSGYTSSVGCEDLEFDRRSELHDSISELKENHFSSLSFSMSTSCGNSLQKPPEGEGACHVESVLDGTHTNTDDVGCVVPSQHNAFISSDPSLSFDLANWSWASDITSTDYSDMNSLDFDMNKARGNSGGQNRELPLYRKGINFSSIALDASCHNQLDNIPYTSNLFMLRPQKFNYSNNLFSMNPMVTKNAFLHVMAKPDVRYDSGFSHSLPFFDFSIVEDPCRVCSEKVTSGSGAESSSRVISQGPATTSKNCDSIERGCGGVDSFVGSTISFNDKENNLTNVSGGGSWESLLCGARKKTVDSSVKGQKQRLLAVLELPLDFVIDKCLVQEIIIQYNYISKLTIKLLDEGFDLQGHLLALRRYHFMELADWADSFVTSLLNHKWCVIEADSKLQDIQGYLELSVQKSSCENDHNKDRLFVYIKEQCTVPLSKATIGIDSFEFLGLGYQVEWPVNIILSPAALRIYADIFSFHIKVKLAVCSLNNVWSSLKDRAPLVRQNRQSRFVNQEVQQFNVLVKTRHQVNHFVCVLQHYVESQLSHVSWCTFRQSLQLKARDVMDLESMHMAYLSDSLHICFLSEETKSVAGIINQILQCALDLKSCFTGDMWNVQVDKEAFFSKLSWIKISQVLDIKKRFDRNMKELQLCYLKSPKLGEFWLSRFWEYLNFNHYYSDFGNEMGYHAF